MVVVAEQIAHSELVGGGQTTKHSHAGGGSLPAPITVLIGGIITGALTAWSNMPAAETEYTAGSTGIRSKIDLTNAVQSRITTRQGVVAVSGAKLKWQYSTDQTTWYDLCIVNLSTSANQTLVGTWTDVPAGAKADVFIRLVGIDGNGVADPSFGLTSLQVK